MLTFALDMRSAALNRPKPLRWFYVLVVYVVLQFCWWLLLMGRLNNEVYQQRSQLNELLHSNPVHLEEENLALERKLQKRMWMITGEGLVFLGLVFTGVYQVRKSLQRMEALSRQQKNFLLSITHELKSPMASARLQLETIGRRALPPETQARLVAQGLADLERLDALTEQILLATRIENHHVVLHPEPLDASAFISQKLLVLKHKWGERLQLQLPPSLPVITDAAALESVVLNLVENALKYSPETAPVQVRARVYEKGWVMEVADWGPGIAPQEKAQVFQKFYRSGNEETRKTKGTGLGLYIVQQLVSLQKGKVTVSDTVPQGATFTVSYPS